MQRAFQYRLYPTHEQSVLLETTLETLRHLYNHSLAERIDAYKFEGKSLGYCDQANQLPLLKTKPSLLKRVHSQVLQYCLKRLEKAYRHFFRRVQQGETPGFPRFKGVGRYRSFTYPTYGSGAKLEGKLLRLSKIGDIAVRVHRELEGTPKTVTLSRQADGWYVSIACEVSPSPLPKTGKDVGIDVGIETFATLSDAHESIPNPRPLQKAQAALRKSQRRLERRTKRDKNHKLTAKQSKRREKAKLLLAKAYQRVQRARKDFHHKTAHALVHQFDTLYVENLNIRGMLKNHQLAHVISDASWGQFFQILKEKAERAVKIVVEVCPRNTSQNCSECGEYVPKALSMRTHSCPYCGLVLHRDKNAAENIRKVGRLCPVPEIGKGIAVGRQREAMACA